MSSGGEGQKLPVNVDGLGGVCPQLVKMRRPLGEQLGVIKVQRAVSSTYPLEAAVGCQEAVHAVEAEGPPYVPVFARIVEEP